MKRILKAMALAIFGILASLIFIAVLFLNLNPQFGRKPNKEQKELYSKSGHYENGKFVNELPTTMDAFSWKLLKERFTENRNRRPRSDIKVTQIDSLEIAHHDSSITRLIWFGHSAFLLQIDGKNLLIDPMLGRHTTPLPIIGPERYSKELPIEIEKLPFMDAVILSHDHYDHLEYESIQKLKSKVGTYFSPLGVGNHLVEWGIDERKIHELNWWDTIDFDGITLVCTPARHFSGRGVFDSYSTLWGSWIIKGKKDNIYFSGDSGYGPHFTEIGDKYGPFDIPLWTAGSTTRTGNCTI